MQKVWKIISIFSIIANIALCLIVFRPNEAEHSTKEYINKIDSLELVLLSIRNERDSVRDRIDTVYANLNETERDYEEIRNVIISNSTSDDYLFFTEYLRRNKARLDSINNLKPAQGN